MELAAIIHQANKRYAYALDKDTFLIRIRLKKDDASKVILHYRDKYVPISFIDTRKEVLMEKYASDGISDYYEANINFHVVCLRYYFEIIDQNNEKIYFGNERFFKEDIESIDYMFDLPQTLREEEAFITPKWAENKIVYQIFPSRFASSADISDDIWYKHPMKHNDNLGGNLRGIINHLDHVIDLGIDIIYLTPIFKSPSSHKYDTVDYYCIEPTFGSKEDLIELVDKCHKNNIKVILDGVFNHTSVDFFAFKDIRENEEKSKYLDWYYIDGFPLKMKWGERPNYKTFSYFWAMPKLNEKNPSVRRYFIDVAKYWLKEAKIDGWRLDVADEISHTFFKEFRRELKEEYPNSLIIGEVWHYADDFLDGDEWDTVMNYDFYFAVKRLLTEESINASEFYSELSKVKGKVHDKVYPLLWNLIDSHDTERFYHSVNYNKDKMKLAAAFQLLFPGMPFIYYGDEYGMQGGKDPDCRRGMYWDSKYQDLEIYEWYKRLIEVRKKNIGILNEDIRYSSDDSKGILRLEKEEYVIVYNVSKNDIAIDELKNKKDLITDTILDGILKGYSVVVYKK